jgi:branched-chain amino acid aminotransferase
MVNINGALMPPDRAFISVFDRGFLYGDSIYEVFRTYRGRLFEVSAHLARLRRSAERIALTLPVPEAELLHQVEMTLQAASLPGDAYIRIIVTRGAGEISLDPGAAVDPAWVILVKEIKLPAPELYQKGVRVELVDVRRNSRDALDPAAKTGNYLNSVLALGQAKQRGGEEALMLNKEGHLTEGSSSNVFLVRSGKLLTPNLEAGILEGITRQLVLELARNSLKLPVEERPITADELLSADEVFLTSTLREVLPVVAVGERRIGKGEPGPVTLQLLKAFRERTRR